MYVDQNREGLDDPNLTVFQAITDGADEIDLGKRKVTITCTACSDSAMVAVRTTQLLLISCGRCACVWM